MNEYNDDKNDSAIHALDIIPYCNKTDDVSLHKFISSCLPKLRLIPNATFQACNQAIKSLPPTGIFSVFCNLMSTLSIRYSDSYTKHMELCYFPLYQGSKMEIRW